ncbi:MAG: oligosaccharide flippase family protein [Planctomycetaceae bacterium]|nr:oligosaccharide flippase family protein [Planctomycetaceae bacterium]
MADGANLKAQDAQTTRTQGFLSQAAKSIAMRVSAAGLTFGMALFIARALGGDRGLYGEYALAISWMNILVILAKLGFDTASLRFVAQYRASGEASLLHGFDVASRRLTLITSIGMSLLLLCVTLLLRGHVSDGVFWCLLISAGLLPVVAGIQLREAGLLAFGRVMAGQTSGVLTPLLLVLFVIAIPRFTGERLSPPFIVLLQLLSSILTLGFVAWIGRRELASVEAVAEPDMRTMEWMQVALPILLVQFLNLMQNQSGTVLCGALLDKEAAGLFSAVARVAGVLFLGLQAINTIAAPTISSLYHLGRRDELDRFVKTCALASGGFAAAFLVVMLPLGRSVLSVFGEQFVEGYVPLLVMTAGLSIAAFAGPVTQFLLMTGHQWDCIRIFSINTVVCLAAALFVIPQYGVLGAAGLAAFARLSSYAAMVFVIKQRHNIWCIATLPSAVTSPPVPVETVPQQRMAA